MSFRLLLLLIVCVGCEQVGEQPVEVDRVSKQLQLEAEEKEQDEQRRIEFKKALIASLPPGIDLDFNRYYKIRRINLKLAPFRFEKLIDRILYIEEYILGTEEYYSDYDSSQPAKFKKARLAAQKAKTKVAAVQAEIVLAKKLVNEHGPKIKSTDRADELRAYCKAMGKLNISLAKPEKMKTTWAALEEYCTTLVDLELAGVSEEHLYYLRDYK